MNKDVIDIINNNIIVDYIYTHYKNKYSITNTGCRKLEILMIPKQQEKQIDIEDDWWHNLDEDYQIGD